MLNWTKLGLVFSPQSMADLPWLKEFAQAPSALVFDEFVRVYFSCRPLPDSNGQYVSYSAYVDLDRADLQRVVAVSRQPILALGGLGTFDEFGTYPVSVIRRGNEVLAYYGGWTRCESVPFNVAIGLAVSTDGGESFLKLGPGPVLSHSPHEPFVLSGPKIRHFGNAWYLWYIAGRSWKVFDGRPEPIYKIRMARSEDGVHWIRANVDIIPDRLGPDEAQASPDVTFSGGKYHMFFCYRQPSDFRTNSQRSYRIGYASSPDLNEWTRDDAVAGLDVSETGWDSQMVVYPHVLELDGHTYMFYLGNETGRHGFGLALLEAPRL